MPKDERFWIARFRHSAPDAGPQRAKKSLGQNFLLDAGIIESIADAALEDGGRAVVEIGPGLGPLTAALLRAGAQVEAIEKDARMVAFLGERFGDNERLIVHEQNVLEFDWRRLAPGTPVVGNLPYNISTPILLSLLSARAHLGPQTLMLQREVAERIAAPPGSKRYGSLSVLLQAYAEPEPLLDVPPEAFDPAPKVWSTVLKLRPRAVPLVSVAQPDLERLTRAAFSQRRKTLRNALRATYPDAAPAAAAAGIDLGRRAETLSVPEFDRLCRALSESRPRAD